MRLTAKQAAERLDISYVVASGLMSHLEDVGKAKIVEKVFHSSGKGKPTRVYEVENNVVLNFGDDVLQPSVVEDVAAPVDVVSETVVEEIVPMTVVAEDTVSEVAEDTTEAAEIVPATESFYYDDDDEDEDDIAA